MSDAHLFELFLLIPNGSDITESKVRAPFLVCYVFLRRSVTSPWMVAPATYVCQCHFSVTSMGCSQARVLQIHILHSMWRLQSVPGMKASPPPVLWFTSLPLLPRKLLPFHQHPTVPEMEFLPSLKNRTSHTHLRLRFLLPSLSLLPLSFHGQAVHRQSPSPSSVHRTLCLCTLGMEGGREPVFAETTVSLRFTHLPYQARASS